MIANASEIDEEQRRKLFEEAGFEFPLKPGFYPEFPIHLLVESEDNARKEAINLIHVRRLAKSIAKSGQIKPILVDLSGTIPEGGHRDLAVQSLNSKTIPVYVANFEEGTRVSAASDSQVKYSDLPVVLGVSSAFYHGIDIEDLSAAVNKNSSRVRDFIRLGLNASPYLLYALQNPTETIPFTLGNAIAISKLPVQDQDFLIKKILREEIRVNQINESVRQMRIQRAENTLTEEEISAKEEGFNWDSFVEQKIIAQLTPLEKLREEFEIKKQSTPPIENRDEFIGLKYLDITPTYKGRANAFRFNQAKGIKSSSEIEEQRKEIKKKNIKKLEELTKDLSIFFQSGIISKRDFEVAQRNIGEPMMRLINTNTNCKSLYSFIKSYSKKNPLEKVLCSFEEAREILRRKLPKEIPNVKLAYPIKFEVKPIETVSGIKSNVRGSVLETILTATELVTSIAKHGILQPLLGHKSNNNGIETICGNRRYWALKIGNYLFNNENISDEDLMLFLDISTGEDNSEKSLEEFKRKLEFAQREIKETSEEMEYNVSNVPLLCIQGEIAEGDRLLLQLAEDSQRRFSPLERAALFAQIYDQNKYEGMTDDDAVKDIAISTPYSTGQVNKYINIWKTLPSPIKNGYLYGLYPADLLEIALDIPERNKIKMFAELLFYYKSKTTLTKTKMREYIAQSSKPKDEYDTNSFMLLNGEGNENDKIGHALASYIKSRLK